MPVISRISPVVWNPVDSASCVRSDRWPPVITYAPSSPMNKAMFASPKNAMAGLEKPRSSAKAPKAISSRGTTMEQQ